LGLLISLCSNFWSASHGVEMLCVLFVFFVRFWAFHAFIFVESLILAQDARWRRASHMQVERKGLVLAQGTRVANGRVTRGGAALRCGRSRRRQVESLSSDGLA